MGDIQQVRTPDLSGLKLYPDATFGVDAGKTGHLATADGLSPEKNSGFRFPEELCGRD